MATVPVDLGTSQSSSRSDGGLLILRCWPAVGSVASRLPGSIPEDAHTPAVHRRQYHSLAFAAVVRAAAKAFFRSVLLAVAHILPDMFEREQMTHAHESQEQDAYDVNFYIV